MQLQWTRDQLTIRSTFKEIGELSRRSHKPSEVREFDQATWDRVLNAGLWHMIVPWEYGGKGRNWWDFTAALEGLASSIRSPGILLSIIAQAGMVRALDRHGSKDQKRVYFKRILAGELSSTAIADPDTGTDVRATSTILTPRSNETFALNGSKFNIAHAPIAGFILVVCKLSDHNRSGISLVLVDRNTKGISFGPEDRKLGNADLPTGQIQFDDVLLDYGHLLGVPGEGLRNLIDIVSLGRLYYGLTAAWIVEPILVDAFKFAQSRETFGVSIIEHQHVQRRLTDIRIRMEAAKWLSYAALDQLLAATPEAVMLCSIAKIVGAESVVESALDLLKLYGSKGYQEGDVAAFVRDALAYCSVGGTEEMHRRNILSQMTRLVADHGANERAKSGEAERAGQEAYVRSAAG